MPLVPQINFPEPPRRKSVTFYCFPPGTSQRDKQHDIAQLEAYLSQRVRRNRETPKCFDCGFPCTRDYKYIDLHTEADGQVRVAIHNSCHKRATLGGPPVEPEQKTNDKEK
jgi:hypothetical protein